MKSTTATQVAQKNMPLDESGTQVGAADILLGESGTQVAMTAKPLGTTGVKVATTAKSLGTTGVKVGIIGAMEVEVALLRERMNNVRVTQVARLELWEGTLGNTEVVVVKSGIGKVAAAMCCELLIERFGVTQVVNTGVAGSLDSSLSIGDMVVSSDCVHHDMDASAIGHPLGQIPELDTFSFTADEQLVACALEAASEVAPDATTMVGRVASGDCFVGDKATHDKIVTTFHASCCEMEGAPIAQVAWTNEVPFVVVRAISDNANDDSVVDYPSFEKEMAQRCAAIVERMVEKLGA